MKVLDHRYTERGDRGAGGLRSRHARQVWQKGIVTIGPGQSPVAELTKVGLDGCKRRGCGFRAPQGTRDRFEAAALMDVSG